jgi:hypothetical protein
MTFQADPSQDKTLCSPRPVTWVAKGDLGIADDETYYTRKAHDSIWISNKGACLDKQGMLSLGTPPLEDRWPHAINSFITLPFQLEP